MAVLFGFRQSGLSVRSPAELFVGQRELVAQLLQATGCQPISGNDFPVDGQVVDEVLTPGKSDDEHVWIGRVSGVTGSGDLRRGSELVGHPEVGSRQEGIRAIHRRERAAPHRDQIGGGAGHVGDGGPVGIDPGPELFGLML